MKEKNMQKGMGTPLTIIIIIIAIIIAGFAYYTFQKQADESAELQKATVIQMEKDAINRREARKLQEQSQVQENNTESVTEETQVP